MDILAEVNVKAGWLERPKIVNIEDGVFMV